MAPCPRERAMPHVLPTLVGLLLCSLGAVAQFGAGNAAYLPVANPEVGVNIIYVYPFTGLLGAEEFSIDVWLRIESYSIVKGNFMQVASEYDDNMISWNTRSLFCMKGKDKLYYNAEGNKWHHYAFTANRLTNSHAFYIDGKYVGRTSSNATDTDLSKPLSILMGNDQDKMLGGFDAGQGAAGYVDNLRVWRRELSAGDVVGFMGQELPSSAVGLVAAWTFEEGSGMVSREVWAGDASWAMTYASIGYSVEQLKSKDLSSCGKDVETGVGWGPSRARASGGRPLRLFASEGGRRTIPLSEVTGSSFIKVNGVSSGVLRRKGGSTVVPGEQVAEDMEWEAPGVMSGVSTIAYTTSDGVAGSIELVHLPALQAKSATVKFPEDVIEAESFFILQADNPLNVPWRALITSLPNKGRLFQVEQDERLSEVKEGDYVDAEGKKLSFMPGEDESAIPYASFTFKAVDEGREGDTASVAKIPEGTVTIHIEPSNDLPRLTGQLEFRGPQDTSQTLDIGVSDADGDDVIMVVHKLPQNGSLWLVDGDGVRSHKMTVSATGVLEVEQYVEDILDYSTAYGATPEASWSPWQVVGPPSTAVYGDSRRAWSASTSDGKCVDRGVGNPFYTEFLHMKFSTPVYIQQMFVYENLAPGAVVGVRALDAGTGRWTRIYKGPALKPQVEKVRRIWEPPGMCGTPYVSNEVVVELDTCNMKGWNEIDAVLLVGTSDYNTGHAVLGRQRVVYVPDAGFVGTDHFEVKFTDCSGNRFHNTPVELVNITIHPAQNPQKIQAEQSGVSVDVSHLGVPPYFVTALPQKGRLLINGYDVSLHAAVQVPVFHYHAFGEECNGAFADSFAISQGSEYNKAAVYHVSGCEKDPEFPYWVLGLVGGILVVIALAVAWKGSEQKRRMAALYNNNRIAESCAVAIASMKLEEVEYLFELEKPNRIQAAFMNIVTNLKEYRLYMPMSILVEASSSSEEDKSQSSSAARSHSKHGVSKKSSSFSSSTQQTGLANLQQALRQRKVTVVHIALTSDLSKEWKQNPNEANRCHAKFVTLAVTSAKELRGVCEVFQGDRICVTWNAVLPVAGAMSSSCRFMLLVKENLSDSLTMAGAASVGSAVCGTMGGEIMKKHGIRGDSLQTSLAGLAYATQHSVLLAPKGVYETCKVEFAFEPATVLRLTRLAVAPVMFYHLLKANTVENEEWMYQMEKTGNELWEKFLLGDGPLPVPPENLHPCTAGWALSDNPKVYIDPCSQHLDWAHVTGLLQ